MQDQSSNTSPVAISGHRNKSTLQTPQPCPWLSAVFSAMDALRAVGGGIATITAVAGQYQFDVQPACGKE